MYTINELDARYRAASKHADAIADMGVTDAEVSKADFAAGRLLAKLMRQPAATHTDLVTKTRAFLEFWRSIESDREIKDCTETLDMRRLLDEWLRLASA